MCGDDPVVETLALCRPSGVNTYLGKLEATVFFVVERTYC